ncbi:MAG: hypothetical protein R3C05_00390 [Pirellulaceae bacterium]
MAPLELVMGIPFLLFLVASTWSLGRVALSKQATAVKVRNATFAQRTTPDRPSRAIRTSFPNPDEAMALSSLADHTRGNLRGNTTSSVRVSHWLGGQRHPREQTMLIVNTWDHRQVDMTTTAPHFSVMTRMVRDIDDIDLGNLNIGELVSNAVINRIERMLQDQLFSIMSSFPGL